MFPVPRIKNIDWQPSASLALIKLRAEILRHIRNFFHDKGVLEVDTPTLSCSTVPDPFIESFQTHYLPLTQTVQNNNYYLHTSPEFPMKRLLASGSGSIYQISKVFRQGEVGTYHNPEFTLLEWYREGWNHHQLMEEVSQLLTELLSPLIPVSAPIFITYEDTFQNKLGFNPHIVSKSELIDCTEQMGLGNVLSENDEKDRFLELLFSHKIQPSLGKAKDGKAAVCLLYNYPAAQASLAKISRQDSYPIAERFEVFINGVEVGNGFNELNDADEQRSRFEAENSMRKISGLEEIPLDQRFLDSLNYLPDCTGVAIGIERLLMLMSQVKHINEVIAFPFEKA